MSRKFLLKVAAVMTAVPVAMAVFMTAAVPASKAEAKGLTQVTDGSKVVYGTASASDIALLKKIFDFEYYKAQNPELVELLGNDYNALFTHFYKYGIFEGRTCNAGFDPSAYVAAYADAKDAAAGDILKAYVHFINVGLPESRPLCTLAACASAGITVESIVDDSVKITPEVYKVAQQLGIDDYQTVNEAIEIAKQQAAAGNEVVITTSDGEASDASSEVKKANVMQGHAVVEKVVLGNSEEHQIYVLIYATDTDSGSASYGAWSCKSFDTPNKLIAYTGEYNAGADNPGTKVARATVNITPYNGAVINDSVYAWTSDSQDSFPVQVERAKEPTVINGTKTTEEGGFINITDPAASASTEYEVGVSLEATETGVDISLAVEGNDGFGLVEEYSIAGESQ